MHVLLTQHSKYRPIRL